MRIASPKRATLARPRLKWCGREPGRAPASFRGETVMTLVRLPEMRHADGIRRLKVSLKRVKPSKIEESTASCSLPWIALLGR